MSCQPAWVPEALQSGVDPICGAVIQQITSDAVTSTNIYCEQRYSSADGSRIAISRKPFGQPNQIWVCDLRTMRLRFVAVGEVLGASHALNNLYYRPMGDADGCQVMKLDFLSLACSPVARIRQEVCPPFGAVSPDGRQLIGGPFALDEQEMHRLYLYDLATGQERVLCDLLDMSNPHMQFDPSGSGLSIVQINRPRHRVVAGLEGESGRWPGASLGVVDTATGRYQPLPAGRPATPSISGHECWAGTTGEILFTAGQYNVTPSSYVTLREPPMAERMFPPAAIYGVRPGDAQARVVAQGLLFNHLAASDDGRYFIADDHTTGRIHIGSIATGRYLPLCESHAKQGTSQAGHVHAYMTPDQAHVIFNSTITGIAQVYAARIPEGFLDALV